MRIKLRLNKLPTLILATLLTSLLFALIIIAAPQTEKLVSNARFNLNLNDGNYWKKEFSLKLTIKNQDLHLKEQKITEIEKILYRRLNDYGVEEVTITHEEGQKETEPILKVTVQSAKDINLVTPLIQQRYFIRLVTRKEGVDFDSEENQFAIFDPTNYEETPFTRRAFRNIYITKLRNTTGDETYFAIFKTDLLNAKDFDDFIASHAGQAAGLRIDGFVTPITIPVPTQSQNGVVTKPVFSVGLNITDEQYVVDDLLFNSGVIPVEYVVDSSKDLAPQVYQINYIQLTLALAGIILATGIYFAVRKDWGSITGILLPFGILVSSGLAFLKLTQTPTDLFIILLDASVVYLFAITILKESDKKYLATVILVLLFVLLHHLGIGYVKTFSLHMAYLLPALLVSSWLSGQYINVIRKTVAK